MSVNVNTGALISSEGWEKTKLLLGRRQTDVEKMSINSLHWTLSFPGTRVSPRIESWLLIHLANNSSWLVIHLADYHVDAAINYFGIDDKYGFVATCNLLRNVKSKCLRCARKGQLRSHSLHVFWCICALWLTAEHCHNPSGYTCRPAGGRLLVALRNRRLCLSMHLDILSENPPSSK